jgi:hypothetical protein
MQKEQTKEILRSILGISLMGIRFGSAFTATDTEAIDEAVTDKISSLLKDLDIQIVGDEMRGLLVQFIVDSECDFVWTQTYSMRSWGADISRQAIDNFLGELALPSEDDPFDGEWGRLLGEDMMRITTRLDNLRDNPPPRTYRDS